MNASQQLQGDTQKDTGFRNHFCFQLYMDFN